MPASPRAFLWDSRHAPPRAERFVPKTGTWWDQYYGGLVRGGKVSATALAELTRTSRDIAGLLPDPMKWDAPRPFRGVVVGAVQSGKTQSMMGVAATALDNGYRVIVVLAGIKDDLRTQTARRFNEQLLQISEPIPGIPGATTLGHPIGPKGAARAFGIPYNLDCHEFAPLVPRMVAAIQAGQPCVVVVKKHPASLSDIKGALAAVYAEVEPERTPLLVLDDECDEATVPGGEAEKPVPEGILALWTQFEVRPPVAYIGYTATAAANLLQHTASELYPHWVYLIRYPGERSSDVEFHEPSSDKWYSGSDCFYSAFGADPAESDNFLVSTSVTAAELGGRPQDSESLRDAFRAYFVGGAYRLAISPGRTFEGPGPLPHPHSMMIHTSAAQEDHSKWAEGIHGLFGKTQFPTGAAGFDPLKLTALLEAEEPRWKDWYERFNAARERIYEARAHEGPHVYVTWEQVRAKLPDVFSYARLKVVNSERPGTSLDFRPGLTPKGAPSRPQDIYVVAVGGSRLSRGITIEGLCVSYFARWAETRHDDTILQMGRWFGYRGEHLEFCRLFTTPSAYVGLREVGENDLHLRAQLAGLMKERKAPRDATIVFRASPTSAPTAKIGAGETLDLSFSPFTRVLSVIETGASSEQNQEMAATLIGQIRNRNGIVISRRSGLVRGVLSKGWSMTEIAAILDGWAFSFHNPDPKTNLMAEFFRPAANERPVVAALAARTDPYQVAAYLRYWAAVGGERIPSFNVGIAFGELDDEGGLFDVSLLNREVTTDNYVVGGWTGSSVNWRGDALFDNPDPNLVDSVNRRKVGADGLLLLYVIHKDARGKSGRGPTRMFHAPFFGIAIPEGGPAFVRVVTAGGTRG
jgi:hypothetical protein